MATNGNVAFPHEEFDPDFDNLTTELDSDDDSTLTVDLPGPKEDDFDIDVVDDTPETDKKARPLARDVAEPSDEELASYGKKARDRIGELTHARHDERRRREALEREHNALVEAARRIQEENLNLRKAYTEGATEYSKVTVSTAETAVAAAKDKLRRANETLDPEEITAAQEALTDAKIQLMRAKDFRAPVVPEPRDVVQLQPSTQASRQSDPELQSWMGRNRWFTDPEHVAETSYALGLHQELVQKGFAAGGAAYYEQIDARMKKRFPELFSSGANDKVDDEPAPRRKTTSPVAQVERTPAGKRRVTLTQSQLRVCQKLGITPQQYAAQIASKGA
jgi:hypothetical protein